MEAPGKNLRMSLRIHLKSPAEKVFGYISTAWGREQFWAESAKEINGFIDFEFINGQKYHSQIFEFIPGRYYKLEYFNSIVEIKFKSDQQGGTDLTLNNYGVADEEYLDVHSGWVSVLLNLKASVDFDIDLRNHDKSRTWDDSFVDN